MAVTVEMCRALVDPRWIGRRIAVAMSGGVDSSVAAVLLARAGCDVVGITMKLWDHSAVGGDAARDGRCCTLESFADCRAVAAQFGFPHYAIDFSERFEQTVIGNFVSEYRAGRTPNPCVVCNTQIKWPALWEKARAFGCEAIATGHYARLSVNESGSIDLRRGADRARDQTYFLWGVARESLERTIFPLGTLPKSEVRRIAAELGLPNAATPESRDICFVADGDLGRFMHERSLRDGTQPTPGSVADRAGRTIGRHDGFEFLTIGQRNGLGVALGRPQYVTKIDPGSGIVMLGDDADLYKRCLSIRGANWLVPPPETAFSASVQIRYRHEAAPTQVRTTGVGTEVIFDIPQRAITPGQSAVFYDDDRVLGGGIIDSAGPD
jgi:tRNA-specific 2-thiouridylase